MLKFRLQMTRKIFEKENWAIFIMGSGPSGLETVFLLQNSQFIYLLLKIIQHCPKRDTFCLCTISKCYELLKSDRGRFERNAFCQYFSVLIYLVLTELDLNLMLAKLRT